MTSHRPPRRLSFQAIGRVMTGDKTGRNLPADTLELPPSAIEELSGGVRPVERRRVSTPDSLATHTRPRGSSGPPSMETPLDLPSGAILSVTSGALPGDTVHRPREQPLATGTIIDRRYRVRDVVGYGGTAVVYKVFDGRRGLERALKLLNLRSSVPDVAERFWQEIRVSASLEHPNIVNIHGYGEWRGKPYLTMELLDGRSMAELLAERHDRPLPIPILVNLFTQAARGLAAAHHAGVIHRDLKPGNLFVSPRLKRLVITDFGLARAEGLTSSITATGIVVGTPSYTPPERLYDSKTATVQSDLYSLGVVFYEAITGQRLFRASSLPEVVELVDKWTPPPPPTVNPAVPRALDQLISSLIHKRPEKRLASAALLADTLQMIGMRL